MMRLRRGLYRIGCRPRRGSIWYSPSLEMIYAMKNFSQNFQAAIENFKVDLKDLRAAIDKTRKEMQDESSSSADTPGADDGPRA